MVVLWRGFDGSDIFGEGKGEGGALVEFGVGIKMEEGVCDGRPRAWAAVFFLVAVAGCKCRRREKCRREKMGVLYIYKGGK